MKRSFHKLSPTVYIGIGVFILFLIHYASGAAHTSVPYGDSDEIITMGHILSVAHPPGYPLVTFLLNGFTRIPLSLNPIHQSHLLASVIHALTLVCIYLSTILVLKEITTNKKLAPNNWMIILTALTGTVALGLSGLFWLYSNVIEVMSLNNLLAASTITIGLYWRRRQLTQTPDKRQWILLAIGACLVGLGLSNVQTYILILPALGVLILSTLWESNELYKTLKSWQFWTILVCGTAAGFLIPTLSLFWLNSMQHDFSWAFDQTLNGWWRLITRRDYAGYIPEKNLQINAYAAAKSINYYMAGLQTYFSHFIYQFNYLAFGLGAIGVVWSLHKKLTIAAILLIGWVIAGIWFGAYLGTVDVSPDNLEANITIGITQRQYIIGYTFWPLFVSLGTYAITSLLVKGTKKNNRLAIAIPTTLLFAVTLYSYQSHHQLADQRHNTIIHQYARTVLDSVEPGSVIICFADPTCYSLLAAQNIEHYRTDVTVLIKNNYYQHYFLERNPEYIGYKYGSNPEFTAQIIAWNLSQRPTYLTEPDQFYINYLGLEANPFYMIPHQYLYQVSDHVPEELSVYDYKLTETLLNQPIADHNYIMHGIKDYFANHHTLTGIIYSQMGQKDQARTNFELAQQLKPDYSIPPAFLTQLETFDGHQNYLPGTQSIDWKQQLLQAQASQAEAIETQNVELMNEAHQQYLRAALMAPQEVEPRWALAELYLENGFFPQAKSELNYLLQYHPEYQPAIDAQQRLQQIIDL